MAVLAYPPIGEVEVPQPSRPAGRVRVETIAYLLVILQLALMIVFSTLQYQRYSLSNDFGGYAQAWREIGTGHLNPWVSVFGVDFLHNNLDLAMYPLALLEPIFHSPIVLNWAQDVAVVATEIVILRWAAEILRRGGVQRSIQDLAIIGLTIALVINPLAWETIAFPLHFEPVAALLAVCAGRSMWRGRPRQLLIWVPLTMSAEALGSVYVFAIGLAGIMLGGHTRRIGAVLCGIGLAGVSLVMALGLVGRNQATLTETYGYVVPNSRGHVNLMVLLQGFITHFGSVMHVLADHLGYVLGYLVAGGVIGVLSPFGCAAVLCILLPDAISQHVEFISFTGAFQNWPVEPFLVIGTVMVLVKMLQQSNEATRGGGDHIWRLVSVIGACLLTADLGLAMLVLPRVPNNWILGRRSATALKTIASDIPSGAEVIADQNVLGRLGDGNSIYSFYRVGQRFPIKQGTVVIVLEPEHSDRDRAILAHLERLMPASRHVSGGGFGALIWRASSRSSITMTA